MEENRFSLLCFKLKVRTNIVFLKTFIPRGVSLVQQGVILFLLCDQTIEDINFSSAFLVELRGVAQLTPLSPMYNAKLPMTPVRHNILVSFYREWENVNFK